METDKRANYSYPSRMDGLRGVVMQKSRIYAQKGSQLNESDRLAMCTLLIKAGYTVRLGKEKQQGKSTYDRFIEYWEDKAE